MPSAVVSEILAPLRSVWFEDTGERRAIVRDCRVCLAAAERYGAGVVSPRGVAHIALAGGDTICGKDATRDAWWWPM